MPDRTLSSAAWLGLQVAAVFMLIPGHLRAGADEREYTLEEVTTRLKEWEAKIQTVRVHTRSVPDPNSKWAVEAGLAGVTRIGYEDWIWTRAGSYRNHHWVTRNSRAWMRSLEANDAVRAWRASYDDGHDETDPRDVTFSFNRQGSPTSLHRLWGQWAPATSGIWIGEAIQQGNLEFVGIDELDGRRCVLMRPPIALNRPDGPLQENYWLDPEHGFLPVQIETPLFSKYIVDEFFEPEPGFFFPKRGQFLHRHHGVVGEAEDWEITVVELNQDLPPALWEPPTVWKKEPDLAEKAAAKGNDFRVSAWAYAIRMTELDFWLGGGFMAIAVMFLAGAIMLLLFKRRKRHALAASSRQVSAP